MPSKNQVKDPREEIVAQGNDLIRHARFPLTALEQNVIYFIISKVKPTDIDFMQQSFTIAEFCEVCGIQPDYGGSQYRTIRAAIKSIRDKSAWVEMADGSDILVCWFDTYKIDRKNGTITATLSQSIKPYLIGLIERAKAGGDGYTQSHLYTYLAMQSKYSKRLYEILKSYLYSAGGTEKSYRLTFQDYELDELKQLLNAYNYTRWVDFKRKALEPSIVEINEVTDIIVSYSVTKTGRRVSMVNFSFQHKQAIERIGAETTAKKVLDTPRKPPSSKNTSSPIEASHSGQMTLDEDNEASLSDKLPDSWENCTTHEQLICFAKAKGHDMDWAYHRAMVSTLPILDKVAQKKIYDNCEFDINIRRKNTNYSN